MVITKELLSKCYCRTIYSEDGKLNYYPFLIYKDKKDKKFLKEKDNIIDDVWEFLNIEGLPKVLEGLDIVLLNNGKGFIPYSHKIKSYLNQDKIILLINKLNK